MKFRKDKKNALRAGKSKSRAEADRARRAKATPCSGICTDPNSTRIACKTCAIVSARRRAGADPSNTEFTNTIIDTPLLTAADLSRIMESIDNLRNLKISFRGVYADGSLVEPPKPEIPEPEQSDGSIIIGYSRISFFPDKEWAARVSVTMKRPSYYVLSHFDGEMTAACPRNSGQESAHILEGKCNCGLWLLPELPETFNLFANRSMMVAGTMVRAVQPFDQEAAVRLYGWGQFVCYGSVSFGEGEIRASGARLDAFIYDDEFTEPILAMIRARYPWLVCIPQKEYNAKVSKEA